MNSFTSNVPVYGQAATVDRLEKRLEELEEQRYKLETRLHFLEYGPPIPVTEFQVAKDRFKNKVDEIEDTKRQLIEARRPPVDPVDRLEKRLEELEEQRYKLETRLHFLEYGPPIPVTEFQAAKDRLKNKVDEIEDTKRQLIEARMPPDAPQNDHTDNLTCCICIQSKTRHELFALVPCGHRCVCEGCQSLMVNQPCPLCRTDTMMVMRVFD